jgi:glycogen operon protein
LGRDPVFQHHFHPVSDLLAAIGQDPVLAKVKCIAEPWDVGPDGYKLGQFPAGWHEWNDRFRDTSRAFWLGFDCTRGELARRLTGSSDYFDHGGRSPLASINLVTAHDGMTLADLTSYSHKHNWPNAENNRDGHHHDLSANAGVEGPTHDEAVQAVRGQWRRALLATLFCSQGIPQLLAGDEFGHSQRGNNNAYCQDNETTWLDWPGPDPELTDFVAGLIHLRHAHVALRHARWFTGGADITWRSPDGTPLTVSDWEDPQSRSFACLIAVADEGMMPTERWLLVFHASRQAMPFALPAGSWLHVLDSAAALVLPQARWGSANTCVDNITLSPRSVVGLVQMLGLPVLPSALQ